MQIGSLIFVVIVATWAAYLLQHWIRQREDAAASGSLDRLSSAVRVLEKRPAGPLLDLATDRTSSHEPAARPALATGDIQWAARVEAPAGRTSPLVARSTHRDPIAAEVVSMPSSPAPRRAGPARPRTQHGAGGVPRPAAPPVSRARRQLRGVLLLLALLWVPVSIGLAIARLLLWISVPFAVLTVVAVLVWLRAEVRADRARAARGSDQAARRQRPAPAPVLSSDDTQVIHPPVARPAARVATTEATGTTDAGPAAPTAPAAADPAEAAAGAPAAAGSAAYDIEADEATHAAAAATASAVSGPPAPGTWQPVPVPPPTYAMKAKAEPRMTEAGIPVDVFATPEFAEEAEELDERALFARRAVSQ